MKATTKIPTEAPVTEARVKKLINEATYNLRQELYDTLDSRDRADQVRRDSEKLSAPVAVESNSRSGDHARGYAQGYAQGYARSCARAEEKVSKLRAALTDSTNACRSNETSIYDSGFKEGHNTALYAVLVLVKNTRTPLSGSALTDVVRKLYL